MGNVFLFTGQSIEEVDFIGDCYLQLVLIQHSIKSIRQHIVNLEDKLNNKNHMLSCDIKETWLEELKSLRTVCAFLIAWSDALNQQCPNP